MSTHSTVGFQINGIIKDTNNHLDSNPEKLDVELVDFLNQLSPNDLITFKYEIQKLRWIHEHTLDVYRKQRLPLLASRFFRNHLQWLKNVTKAINRLLKRKIDPKQSKLTHASNYECVDKR